MGSFKAHSLQVNPLVFGGVYRLKQIPVFWMVDPHACGGEHEISSI